MGHALDETLRVVRPALPSLRAGGPWRRGVLDVRPRPDIGAPQVVVRAPAGQMWPCGALISSEERLARHAAAERLITGRIASGKLQLLAQREFDWSDTYESADDLVEHVLNDWVSHTMPETVALTLAQRMADAPKRSVPMLRQPIGLRLLHQGAANT